MANAPKPPAQVPSTDLLVQRSAVPPGRPYQEYRQYLRHDFFHSCAYCTISESEAAAIRFTIDHYEPRTSRADLTNDYSNLMYSCDACNRLKGNRCPPPTARANGLRFFRPDHDLHSDHFDLNRIRLDPKTRVGEFSIEGIDLNRLSLRKLRDFRRRLSECDTLVAAGVLALRDFHTDQLPKNVKAAAINTIGNALSAAEKMAEGIDGLLREFAHSPLIDPDPDFEQRSEERSKKIKGWQAVHAGMWRGTNKKNR